MPALLVVLVSLPIVFQVSSASQIHNEITIRRTKSSRARPLTRQLLNGEYDDAPNVELSDFYNNEFVGTIGVGSPPQLFTVVFDTGTLKLS